MGSRVSMKKVSLLCLTMVLCFGLSGMAFSQTKEDIHLHKACQYCGMDRGMHDFSRVLILYDDGTTNAFCSLHCAAVDLANNIDKTPKAIKVGDFNGRQLIDAEKAFWIIGGNKPGVMSKRGKWAFEKQGDAERFLSTNQGKVASFEDAMKMAYEDMYDDTKMIRDRRKMKRMQAMEEQKPGSGH
jgi:copper chaperone NosL